MWSSFHSASGQLCIPALPALPELEKTQTKRNTLTHSPPKQQDPNEHTHTHYVSALPPGAKSEPEEVNPHTTRQSLAAVLVLAKARENPSGIVGGSKYIFQSCTA